MQHPLGRRGTPSWTSRRAVAIATMSGVLIGVLTGLAMLTRHPIVVVALLVGVVGLFCGIWVTWLAFARFELFLLGLFAVRPLLDALKIGGAESALSPSIAAGLLFLIAATWRLYHIRRAGRWVSLSWMSLAFMTMPIAELLSVPLSVSASTSLISTLRLLTGAVMFVILEQELGSGNLSHRRLMRWVMASLVLVVPYCLMQEITGFGIEFDTDIMATRVQGPFVHPSVLAKYLVILLLWMVAAWSASVRRTRVILFVGILMTVVILELTLTRVAWLAALLGVLYILGRRNWRLVPGIIALVLAAVVAIPSLSERISSLFTGTAPLPGVPANSLQWRLEYWQQLIPLARMSPFNGLGAGTATIVGGDGLEAHNTWVQLYVETGLFGLAALLLTIAGFFFTLRSVSRESHLTPVTSHRRAVADAAISCAIVLFVFIQTENLLTETTTLWYSAAVLCGALRQQTMSCSRPPPEQSAVR